MSHPVWVRGLKLLLIRPQFQTSGVAPRVGAWIETLKDSSTALLHESHPVWVRGLKHKL